MKRIVALLAVLVGALTVAAPAQANHAGNWHWTPTSPWLGDSSGGTLRCWGASAYMNQYGQQQIKGMNDVHCNRAAQITFSTTGGEVYKGFTRVGNSYPTAAHCYNTQVCQKVSQWDGITNTNNPSTWFYSEMVIALEAGTWGSYNSDYCIKNSNATLTCRIASPLFTH